MLLKLGPGTLIFLPPLAIYSSVLPPLFFAELFFPAIPILANVALPNIFLAISDMHSACQFLVYVGLPTVILIQFLILLIVLVLPSASSAFGLFALLFLMGLP